MKRLIIREQYRVKRGDIKADRKDILQLWERNFSSCQEERFSWMYERNPEGVPQVWFLYNIEDKVVGMMAVCPRLFFLKGVQLKAGQTMDLVVDSRHRSLGPAMQLQRTVIESMDELGYDFLYGFPNKKSRNVQKRIGFIDLCVLRRWIVLLKSKKTVERYLQNRLITSVVAKGIDGYLNLRNSFLYSSLPDGYYCEESPLSIDELDTLWSRVDRDDIATGDRRGLFMQWRLSQVSHLEFKCFCLYDNTGLAGYIIYAHYGNSLVIIDFFALSHSLIKSIFSSYISMAKEGPSDKICLSVSGKKEIIDIISACGFIERPSDEYILVKFEKKRLVDEMIVDNSFFITGIDRDV